LRVEIDFSAEKLGYKIRQAQLEKLPYMLILGEKEAKEKLVAIRDRTKGDLGAKLLGQFLLMLKKEIDNRRENVV